MYEELLVALNGLVATSAWSSTFPGINTYPADYTDKPATIPFMKFSIVFPTPEVDTYGEYKRKGTGLIIIQIYYATKEGRKVPSVIADKLDSFLIGKVLSNTLQLTFSSLQFLGQDSLDKTLSRADYSLPFTFSET